jgi:hypothetical protein
VIAKRILNIDKAQRGETAWLLCCWADCEKHAVDLHKTMHHDHARGIPCHDLLAKHPVYTFCSERHRQLFLNSHRSNGNLPTGSRGMLI